MGLSLLPIIAAGMVFGAAPSHAFAPLGEIVAPRVILVDLDCSNDRKPCEEGAKLRGMKCIPYIPYGSPRNYRPTQWCVAPK